jgi:putative transport protein
MVTNRSVAGKTLPELARSEYANGVFLRKLTRAGQDIPVATITSIDRGDLVRLIGTKPKVDRAAQELGYPDRPTTATDMVFVGTGIVLGGFVGLLGHRRRSRPRGEEERWSWGSCSAGCGRPICTGRIPEAAIWVFDTLGLCVFIAVVGLNAGPSFVAGLKTSGISLVFVGLVAELLPHTVGILFGRYVLKMNPLIVLGACAGAGTITAALRATQDEAQSNVPAIGYTVPYAVGNILLTAWGPVLVGLMSLGK